jgi:hypothetical protein
MSFDSLEDGDCDRRNPGPLQLQAQGKIASPSGTREPRRQSWWFWATSAPAARNHIDTAFSENEVLSKSSA